MQAYFQGDAMEGKGVAVYYSAFQTQADVEVHCRQESDWSFFTLLADRISTSTLCTITMILPSDSLGRMFPFKIARYQGG